MPFDLASLQSHIQISTHKQHLILTALAASLGTAALFSGYSLLDKRRRKDRRRELEGDALRSIIGSKNATRHGSPVPEDIEEPHIRLGGEAYAEHLIREQLARNYAFFGEEPMARIRKARVVVVGCGGVGSWAAVMLVRSGISHIRLIDFDYVTLSSLNRHATAMLSDVGTPKVACVARRLREFSRWVEVDTRTELWKNDDGGKELLDGADWVIDAIDNIQTKVDLLHYCHSHNIPVFSSMGAGAKTDPTRIQIADIANTIYDPLARAVRRRLRSLGVPSGIPVVYSTEVPGDVKLLPLPEEEFAKGKVQELGVMDEFRVRVLPVLGPLPAIFGLNAATYVLAEIGGKPIPNPLPVKNRRKVYEKLLRDLQGREAKRSGAEPGVVPRLPIDEDDVALIFEDIHRGRSIIPPHPVPTTPTLVRWDPAMALTPENVVVMERKEATRHENGIYGATSPVEMWGAETDALVEKHRKQIRRVREWVDWDVPNESRMRGNEII
ncbi:ThiF domain-containing protein [Mycena indigotica]|uniref:ThiF domain-containing protein n=1 Tax=Mycena indigotica TaxID=2126181 RepID=A0A8H6SFQ6_9AGAR|nr:ThiF domain-containing protein [Mycena indigotica]KAF7298564.1 ThiF domain-containing protein [Mycena indigotica]